MRERTKNMSAEEMEKYQKQKPKKRNKKNEKKLENEDSEKKVKLICSVFMLSLRTNHNGDDGFWNIYWHFELLIFLFTTSIHKLA